MADAADVATVSRCSKRRRCQSVSVFTNCFCVCFRVVVVFLVCLFIIFVVVFLLLLFCLLCYCCCSYCCSVMVSVDVKRHVYLLTRP